MPLYTNNFPVRFGDDDREGRGVESNRLREKRGVNRRDFDALRVGKV